MAGHTIDHQRDVTGGDERVVNGGGVLAQQITDGAVDVARLRFHWP
jgi:hypothetical protein